MMKLAFSPGSVKSLILVLIQFICLGIIAFTGRVIPSNFFLLICLIFSLILAFWSMVVMKFHFNAAPDILSGATMKTIGPYKVIRHPMYSSLILLDLVWIIDDFSVFRLIVFLVLVLDLVLKTYHEEKLLIKEFENYSEYKKHTKRIIPLIY